MGLPGNMELILMTPPEAAAKAGHMGLKLAHMSYRVGGGPHLFCARYPASRRGGLMVLDHRGFDGKGEPDDLCREIYQECAARGIAGLFCDFEGPTLPVLERTLERLSPIFQKNGWSLYIPEPYALHGPRKAKVVIPTALTVGSLRGKLSEAVERFGAERLAVGLERVAEEFRLPASDGAGRRLEREELARLLRERSPAVYFSDELCAHYFTYMDKESNARFVLYDDASSLSKKIRVASALGIRQGFLPWDQAGSLIEL